MVKNNMLNIDRDKLAIYNNAKLMRIRNLFIFLWVQGCCFDIFTCVYVRYICMLIGNKQ